MYIGNDASDTLMTLTSQAVGTVTGGTVDAGQFPSVVAYMNVTAITGTTPTANVKLQDSPDGADWYDTGVAFAQVTVAGKQRIIVSNVGQYIRAVAVVAGTGASVSAVVSVAGVR